MLSIPQLEIRKVNADQDIPRLVSLYAAIDAVDHTGIEMTEQTLWAQLSSASHTEADARWVAEIPGDPISVIASALVNVSQGNAFPQANILVHPEWRRQGIGSQLLATIIEHARTTGMEGIQTYASPAQPAGSAFLHKHAFRLLGAYTELRLKEGIRLPPVIWPFGYTMRPYSEVGDISVLTEAMNLSYILLWGHREVSEAEMTSWMPGFNPESIFLVFSEKGRVIGVSHAEPSAEQSRKNGAPTGIIDAPGIVTQHRRLDLYRALVLTGIQWLHEHGQSLVEMESWGDKQEVLKMYRELGFVEIRQLACFQLDLKQKGECK